MSRLLQLSSASYHVVALAIWFSIRWWQWTVFACIGMGHISCMYHSGLPAGRLMYLTDVTYNHSIVTVSALRTSWMWLVGAMGDNCMYDAWKYMGALAYISVLYYGLRLRTDAFHSTIHLVSAYGIYHYAVLEHKYQMGLCWE